MCHVNVKWKNKLIVGGSTALLYILWIVLSGRNLLAYLSIPIPRAILLIIVVICSFQFNDGSNLNLRYLIFDGLKSEVKTRIPGRPGLAYSRVKFLFQMGYASSML